MLTDTVLCDVWLVNQGTGWWGVMGKRSREWWLMIGGGATGRLDIRYQCLCLITLVTDAMSRLLLFDPISGLISTWYVPLTTDSKGVLMRLGAYLSLHAFSLSTWFFSPLGFFLCRHHQWWGSFPQSELKCFFWHYESILRSGSMIEGEEIVNVVFWFSGWSVHDDDGLLLWCVFVYGSFDGYQDTFISLLVLVYHWGAISFPVFVFEVIGNFE